MLQGIVKNALKQPKSGNQKIYSKDGTAFQFTVCLYGSAVGLHNRLCQRKPQSDPLGVLGESASIESLKDMGQILRMDTAAAVAYNNLDDESKFPPFYTDRISFFRMVECVFYNVADRLRKPGPVTEEKNGIIPRERQGLSV